MSTLGGYVDDYLRTRRALGFKLEREGRLLPEFAAALDRAGTTTVTVGAALAWATGPPDADPSWWGARLAMVRVFARWLQAFEPATEVPPAGLLPARSQRAEPYPYVDDDIAALMGTARRIRTAFKAATYETLIGLLAATGMRVGEVIALNRGDLDEGEGLLVVRASKFGRSRAVVLHPTTLKALRAYATVRDGRWPRPATQALFVSVAGTRLIYQNVHLTFHRLVAEAGLRPRSARCRPRIHDLRHRFAVEALLRWVRAGEDVEARLPQLSAYLGHACPSDTYWYLRAAPELMALAAGRLEAAQEPRR
jgi:integrase/recombinase XerD